jgi:hypothetical protein
MNFSLGMTSCHANRRSRAGATLRKTSPHPLRRQSELKLGRLVIETGSIAVAGEPASSPLMM